MARTLGKIRFVFLLLLLAPAACRHSQRAAAVPAGPRIVSTVPAATQILLQIGGGSTLVGVSRFDKPLLPPIYQSLPVVGDYFNLDDELLLNLQPTVLIIQKSPLRLAGLPDMARQNHIRLVNVSFNRIRTMEKTVLLLGKLAHRTAAARQAVATLQHQLGRYAAELPPRANRPRVVYLVGTAPMRAVGSDNFIDSVIHLAGGINIGTQLGSGFPVLTHETLLNLKPQIILWAMPGAPVAKGSADPRIAEFLHSAAFASPLPRVFLLTDRLCEMPTLKITDEIKQLRGFFKSLPGSAGGSVLR